MDTTGFVNIEAPAPVRAASARPAMPKRAAVVDIRTAAQKRAEADAAAALARASVATVRVDAAPAAPAPLPAKVVAPVAEPVKAPPKVEPAPFEGPPTAAQWRAARDAKYDKLPEGQAWLGCSAKARPVPEAPAIAKPLPMGKYRPFMGCNGEWHGTPPEHRKAQGAWRRQPGYSNR